MGVEQQHRYIEWAKANLTGEDLDRFILSLGKLDEIATINHRAIVLKYNQHNTTL